MPDAAKTSTVFPPEREKNPKPFTCSWYKEVMDCGRTQIPEKRFNSNLCKAKNFMLLYSKISNTQILIEKKINKIPTELSSAKF